MADKSFRLEILTPREKLFSGSVVSLVAPAAQGYLGVLADHAPMVTTLTQGKIVLRPSPGAAQTFESKGPGILEVHQNQVTLLLDEIVAPSSKS